MLGIKKVQGGSLEDTMLVTGVAFQKTFSYAGFEMQQKQYENPKVTIKVQLSSEYCSIIWIFKISIYSIIIHIVDCSIKC